MTLKHQAINIHIPPINVYGEITAITPSKLLQHNINKPNIKSTNTYIKPTNTYIKPTNIDNKPINTNKPINKTKTNIKNKKN